MKEKDVTVLGRQWNCLLFSDELLSCVPNDFHFFLPHLKILLLLIVFKQTQKLVLLQEIFLKTGTISCYCWPLSGPGDPSASMASPKQRPSISHPSHLVADSVHIPSQPSPVVSRKPEKGRPPTGASLEARPGQRVAGYSVGWCHFFFNISRQQKPIQDSRK